MISSQGWTSTALAALTAASLWLYVHAGRPGADAGAARQGPELSIDEPRWRLFDAAGQPRSLLRAERLERWQGEDGARLIQPRLQLQDRHERVWRISAASGRIYTDRRPLLLQQQVTVQREPENAGLELETGRLRIAADGSRMESDAPVVLRSGSWHFSAGGLRADLELQRLELFNGVRGIHD